MGEIKIDLGALAAPLSIQLAGFNITREAMNIIQEDLDAINRLSLRSLISDTVRKQALARLTNEINAEIKKAYKSQKEGV